MKRFHASGICDCCDAPPEDEAITDAATQKLLDRQAMSFELRCARYAAVTEPPLIPATRRLAWACQDECPTAWDFNRREVRELKALIDNLLEALLS